MRRHLLQIGCLTILLLSACQSTSLPGDKQADPPVAPGIGPNQLCRSSEPESCTYTDETTGAEVDPIVIVDKTSKAVNVIGVVVNFKTPKGLYQYTVNLANKGVDFVTLKFTPTGQSYITEAYFERTYPSSSAPQLKIYTSNGGIIVNLDDENYGDLALKALVAEVFYNADYLRNHLTSYPDLKESLALDPARMRSIESMLKTYMERFETDWLFTRPL